MKHRLWFTVLFVGEVPPSAEVRMAPDWWTETSHAIIRGLQPGAPFALIANFPDAPRLPSPQRFIGAGCLDITGGGRVVATGVANSRGEAELELRPALPPVGSAAFRTAVEGRGQVRSAPVAFMRALAAV